MTDYMINCENFITLFITLKQVELSDKYNSGLYMNLDWSFSIEALNSFICYSQRNPKYIKLLEAFDVVIDSSKGINQVVNMRLMLALNKARERHLITTIVGDIAYMSKVYMIPNVLREYYYLEEIMRDFIADFEIFAINPSYYLDEIQMIAFGSEQVLAQNERYIYNLQRKIWYENEE